MFLSKVGKITKKWVGAIKELFTDADTFALNFSKDLDPKSKAIILGTAILIDFAFFEENE